MPRIPRHQRLHNVIVEKPPLSMSCRLYLVVMITTIWFRTVLSEVVEYTFNTFPKNVVALHMPCEESNVFATKCMCHIQCTDNACSNARALCSKYETSKGCKYMLLRQVGKNKVATLKRVPTADELSRFDTSDYPQTRSEFSEQAWKAKAVKRKDSRIRNLMPSAGQSSNNLVDRIFKTNSTGSNPLCPMNSAGTSSAHYSAVSTRAKFYDDSIALAVLSYHTPKTLVNSLRTWNSSGLLDMVAERVAVLNDPLPSEHAMALHHGFEVLQPKDVPGGKTAKPNVFTIGAAFYYTLQHVQSEYLLFLENDFKMDTALSRKEIQAQLVGAAGMLRNGAEVVRLMSRKYQGCGTFKTCDHHGIHLDSSDPGERNRNWYSFYCRGHPGSAPYVADCLHEPDFRCFTSWDTNWTLNAVMVKKSTMLTKQYKNSRGQLKTIAEVGLASHKQQDGFESSMLNMWAAWKVPVCISYDGLFIHEEIETSA